MTVYNNNKKYVKKLAVQNRTRENCLCCCQMMIVVHYGCVSFLEVVGNNSCRDAWFCEVDSFGEVWKT